jgi:hypothetical protein
MQKKPKEPAIVRAERIQSLGGFGAKRTQVVTDKTKYNRKSEKTGIDLSSSVFIPDLNITSLSFNSKTNLAAIELSNGDKFNAKVIPGKFVKVEIPGEYRNHNMGDIGIRIERMVLFAYFSIEVPIVKPYKKLNERGTKWQPVIT